MASGGYDFDVAGEVIREYLCPICLLLIREAIDLPCIHSLCNTCLEKWQYETNLSYTEHLCPICKTVYDIEKVHANRVSDRIITTSLRIKCKASQDGCDWTGTISDFEHHDKSCCKFKLINCSWEGCHAYVNRFNLELHQSSCLMRSIVCEYCHEDIIFNDQIKHFQTCSDYPVSCPNSEECLCTFKRSEINNHQQICEYEYVACEFSNMGCDAMVNRKDQELHLQTSLCYHVTLMLNYTKENNIELQQVKEELQMTKEEVIVMKEEVIVMKDEMIVMKEEIILTNDKLCETEKALLNAQNMLEKNQNVITAMECRNQNTVVGSKKEIEDLKSRTNNIEQFSSLLLQDCYVNSFKNAENSLRILPIEAYNDYQQNLESFKLVQKELSDNKESAGNFQQLFCKLRFYLKGNTQNNYVKTYYHRLRQSLLLMTSGKLYEIGNEDLFIKVNYNIGKRIRLTRELKSDTDIDIDATYTIVRLDLPFEWKRKPMTILAIPINGKSIPVRANVVSTIIHNSIRVYTEWDIMDLSRRKFVINNHILLQLTKHC